MSSYTLYIGNKNYSSWSLRPWLLLKALGVPFEERRIPLYQSDSKSQILAISPSGKVPALHHGNLVIWDSLAICEYLAEPFPQAWPTDPAVRAQARSVSAEMHSGFLNLRKAMPMNCRVQLARPVLDAATEAEVQRVVQIWEDCRTRYGHNGPFLFGQFSIADAMWAPVALRFKTYSLKLPALAQAYAQSLIELKAVQSWCQAGAEEQERLPQFERDSSQ